MDRAGPRPIIFEKYRPGRAGLRPITSKYDMPGRAAAHDMWALYGLLRPAYDAAHVFS